MTKIDEIVINFHMTEACNFKCGYCYAKWSDNYSETELHHSSSHINSLMQKLSDYFFSDNQLRQKINYKSVRINFAGGEPVMLGKRFTDAILLAKSFGFRTSIITNGHLLSDSMITRVGPHIDMLGVSFDTADNLIAQSIGRIDRNLKWLSPDDLLRIVQRYKSINPLGTVKINTVVNSFNWREDLSNFIQILSPDKWKILRVLPVYGEQLTVSDIQYYAYVKRHERLSLISTVEDNTDMWQSYLMINPQGRFYQNTSSCNGLVESPSILEEGVDKALGYIDFSVENFAKRYIKNSSRADEASPINHEINVLSD